MGAETPDPLSLPWRVGRHVGRTIYAQAGDEASRETDVLIGVMDTVELAAEACRAYNERLRGAGAEEITLNTIRRWAEGTIEVIGSAGLPHAAGYQAAARDVLAILNMHGAPPDEPVMFVHPADAR
jgi:hypothetical protein